MRIFGNGKCEFIANFSATMVTSLPSVSLSHRKYLMHNIGSASALPILRRKNDHPGGQGRIFTSNLNFVFTHLSKPGHRRGWCCMFPRCLLRQFVDRCLLSWALFIEKTVLLCFARFLSKWRETALWMFPDATQAGTSCTFECFRDDGDR